MNRLLSLDLPKEELANAVTHGLGVLLSLIAVPYLLLEGAEIGNQYQVIGLAVFGVSMMLVYLSSTIYHTVTAERLKDLWHRIDHISIYFLIAGTHTPILLFCADASHSETCLYLVWGMVAIGVLYKLFFFGRLKLLSVLYYVAMGWLAILTIPPMLETMGHDVLFWIIAGGVSYSLGVVFFLWDKLPYNHAIWHLFVLGGSAGHFIAMVELIQG